MAREKVYPVKTDDTAAALAAAYEAKFERNKAAGLAGFRDGTYKPFSGIFAKEQANTFGIFLELSTDSQEMIRERVVAPLEELARKHAVPAIFAGYGDLPSHVTLQGGVFNNLTSDQREVVRGWLSSKYSHMGALSDILTGLQFTLDALVVAPNSYLCKRRFDDSQGAAYRIRKAVETIMTHGVERLEVMTEQSSLAPPFSYADIFHSSVARITRMAAAENLLAFAQEAYDKIQTRLTEKPIEITVASVLQGTGLTLWQKYRPNLLIWE